jgi:hypothetical protein
VTAQRRAPAVVGTGIPVDGREAYLRGLCRDCMAVWHAPGRPRCDDCHEVHVSGGGLERTRISGGVHRTRSGAA